jgi:stress-induced-phosphoprotein 1
MISVLGVLMGIDMQGFAREEGSNEMPPGFSSAEPTSPTSPPTSPPPFSSRPAPAPAKKQEDVKMAEPEEPEEVDEEKKAALAEKAKGNDSYKKRDFDGAIASFKKAWELWPKDITFLTNLAGMWDFYTNRCRANQCF